MKKIGAYKIDYKYKEKIMEVLRNRYLFAGI